MSQTVPISVDQVRAINILLGVLAAGFLAWAGVVWRTGELLDERLAQVQLEQARVVIKLELLAVEQSKAIGRIERLERK